jgi:AmmeMemoRadiSam system protein A
MIGDPDRTRLLKIARDAVTSCVSGATVTETPLDVESDGLATGCAGVFVTVHVGGDLRGCIGRLEAAEPLQYSIARCAIAACSDDPRFPAVRPSELAMVQLEISLLGPMQPAAGPADIEIGRHGLMIESGGQRGLLLPQVAVEWRWDAETFFAQTCSKAGLRPDSWRRGATVWKFEAEVFGDCET